jgi:hypothetical protein
MDTANCNLDGDVGCNLRSGSFDHVTQAVLAKKVYMNPLGFFWAHPMPGSPNGIWGVAVSVGETKVCMISMYD